MKQIHARAPLKSKNVAKSAGCLVALPESAHVVLHLLGSVFCPLSLKGIQRSFTKIEHKKHVSRLVIACRYMSGTREYNPHNKSNMQACVAATVLTSNYLIRNVAARKCNYVCPFCKGHVASKLKTGQIDHRTVCGNRFYVKEGTVSAQTRQHPQRCPACHSVVWSTLLFGRIQATHNTPSGKQCPTKSWLVPESKRDTTK